MHASRRKIFLSILLLLALCLLPACLLADADGFTFSGENNSILTKYTGTEVDIVIPDHVKRIAAQAFADNKAIQNVTFPDTLEAIETGA